jgi:hypothetical protein
MASGAGPSDDDFHEYRIDALERQNNKLTHALRGCVNLLQEALKPLESPVGKKNPWNPILIEIGKGHRITEEQCQNVAQYLNYDVYQYNETLNKAIIKAFRDMTNQHIRTEEHKQLVKMKKITVRDAMTHISNISKLESDSKLLQYFSSRNFLDYIQA